MTDDSLDKPLFASESNKENEEPTKRELGWKVLVIDDEQGVHDVTIMALKRFEFQNRKIEFLHAYSAKEAKDIFDREEHIAVAFVDVVMERDDAGL